MRSFPIPFLALSLCLMFISSPARGMGRSPGPLTLIMLPTQHSLMQVGRDMADRENVLLMSYAGAKVEGELFLHAWDGSTWVRIPERAYRTGVFLRNPSARIVVVGTDAELSGDLVEGAVSWSPEILHIETLRVTDLINTLGRLFGFEQEDWEWFAESYELNLMDLNRDMREQSWYDMYRASDLPPAEIPWRSRRARPGDPVPETSLDPIEVIGPEGSPADGLD